MRHGEGENNLKEYYDDGSARLTEKGVEQAKAVAKRFKGIKIDVIVCSKYERAIKTAAEISKTVNTNVFYTDLLNEITHPSEIITKDANDKKAVEVDTSINEHMFEKDWHYSDEENIFDFNKRADKAIDYLLKLDKENVLVVAHGTLIRHMLALMMLKKGPENISWSKKVDEITLAYIMYDTAWFMRWIENSSITVVERHSEGGWRLVTFNDFTHL